MTTAAAPEADYLTRVEEASDYDRLWEPPDRSRTLACVTIWTFSSKYVKPAGGYPRVRMRLHRTNDGEPIVFPWFKPTSSRFALAFTAPDHDYYLQDVEIEGVDPRRLISIRRPLIVNGTGKALPHRTPWVAVDRFDVSPPHILANVAANGGLDGRFYARLRIPAVRTPSPTYALKPRTLLPIANHTNAAQMYFRRVGIHHWGKTTEAFEVPTPGAKPGECDVALGRFMNYFYAQLIAFGGKPNALRPPSVPCRDGVRGEATFPGIAKIIRRPGGQGYDVISTLGFHAYINAEFARTTLAGWVSVAGMFAPHPDFRDSDPEWHDAHFDLRGDWSRVSEPKRPGGEWWGLIVAEQFEAGNHHEFWYWDTVADRIIFANHGTAHDEGSYWPARWAPPGYDVPAHPSGKLQLADYLANDPHVKQGWDGVPVKQTDGSVRFVWTNFDVAGKLALTSPIGGGGFIASGNARGRTIEELDLRFEHFPKELITDRELGITTRLDDASQAGPFGTKVSPNDVPDVLCGKWFGKAPTDFAPVDAGALTINGVAVPALPAATSSAQRVTQVVNALNAVAGQSHVRAWATPSGAYTPLKLGTTIERVGWTDKTLSIVVRDAVTTARTGFESVVRKMYVVDGPVHEATCVHPQGIVLLADGRTIAYGERYPYVVRTMVDGYIRTVQKIRPLEFAGTSSGDTDISISVDARNRVSVATWRHFHVYDANANWTRLGAFGGTPVQSTPPGLGTQVSPVEYCFGAQCTLYAELMFGNAGQTMLEATQRLPGDVVPDMARRLRGYNATILDCTKSVLVTGGAEGECTTGAELNIEALGAYSDAALGAYYLRRGMPEAKIGDQIYRIRSVTQDYVYPQPLIGTPPVDYWSLDDEAPSGGGNGTDAEDPAVIAQQQAKIEELQGLLAVEHAARTSAETAFSAEKEAHAATQAELDAAVARCTLHDDAIADALPAIAGAREAIATAAAALNGAGVSLDSASAAFAKLPPEDPPSPATPPSASSPPAPPDMDPTMPM